MQKKTKIEPDTQLEERQAEGVTVRIQRTTARRSRYVMRYKTEGAYVLAIVPQRWNSLDIRDMLHRHRRWLALRAADAKAAEQRRQSRPAAHLASPLPPAWYRRAAAQTLPPRVKQWSQVMKLNYSKISISSSRRQWGCCNARKEIRFSWRLLMVPPELADYVIVHELAHLTHLNHGKRFWALVEKYVPDYAEKRKNLNKLGATLD